MKKVYIIGVCGSGMSALAGLLKEKGFEIVGVDSNCYSPSKDILERESIKVKIGYDPDFLKSASPDIVVVGNIVGRGNPEVEYLLSSKKEFYSLPEALNKFIVEKKDLLMVSGSYGKTTTAGWLAYSMKEAGVKIGFFIGGEIVNYKKNYFYNPDAEIFIMEGDEYETSFFDERSKFLHFSPETLILRELSHDHIDKFESENQYLNAFKNLFKRIRKEGFILSHYRNREKYKIEDHFYSKYAFFGHFKSNEKIVYSIKDFDKKEFEVFIDGKRDGLYSIKSFALYDVENALPAIFFLRNYGIKQNETREIIYSFKGIRRRTEIVFENKEMVVIDDFSHHPDSLKRVINEVKKAFKDRKLIIYFEPSSFSMKMKKFETEIISALSLSDFVFFEKPKRSKKLKDNDYISTEAVKEKLKDKVLILKNDDPDEKILKLLEEIKLKKVFLIVSTGKRRELNEKDIYISKS